jgi:hypothetical protein
MHREVIDIPEGMVCDHINRKVFDNRKGNLRPATVSQNNCNTRKRAHTTSRYRGVSWYARLNKWMAQINANGRRIHLGVFDDEVDAAKTYDAAARKYHGEFAVLNFPDRTPSWIIVWICRFFAAIAERIKPSLRTGPKGESGNLLTSHCEAEGGNHPQASLEAATLAIDYGFLLPAYAGAGFAGMTLGKQTTAWATSCPSYSLIEIARKCAPMNTVQMARGP